MKKLITSIKAAAFALAAIALITLPVPKAEAADYAVQKTFYSFAGTDTNVVGQKTNLNAAIDCTQFTDFMLEFRATGTNAAGTATGGFAVAWEYSADNSNWGTVDTMSQHWFGIPTTNKITTVFVTNITVNAIGYWRLAWLTNNSAHCITNMSIKGYVKPKRTARDQ